MDPAVGNLPDCPQGKSESSVKRKKEGSLTRLARGMLGRRRWNSNVQRKQ